jgi:hypothetical protein
MAPTSPHDGSKQLQTSDTTRLTLNRREMLKRALVAGLAAAAAGVAPAAASESVTLPFGNGERPLVAYPGKRPLIVLTSRPPQLETPSACSTRESSRLTTRSSFATTWPTFR